MTAPGVTETSRGWTPNDATFGARLALVRQYMKWGNVKEAAVACGLPTESWRSWERDGRTPQRIVQIAAIIAERTGCDHTWLVMGSSRGAGTGRRGNDLNDSSRQTVPSADVQPAKATRPPVRANRHTAIGNGPYGGGRRDATRPVSAVPFTKRRPARMGPGNRPIPT